jgi:lipopolysaccharide biosynthesis protein
MTAKSFDNIRLVAFYLTQFHPTPENDLWWGKGFTEWTNVTKAQPLFQGHYQPHLPTDLSFYDLRLREVRHQQITMAKQYGIEGFCYHYYWFSGTRLLNKPLDDMFADPESDMPYCLCWANENWTRRWNAAEHEVLIAQKYQPDDDLNFIKDLIPHFKDPRYIRLDGAPVLIVYRPQHLPDASKTLQIWRDYCRDIGIEHIHLCAALTHGNVDYAQYGFDSGVEFPPHNNFCRNVNTEITFHKAFRGNVLRYEDMASAYLSRQYKPSNVFRTVVPCWDNTARTNDRAMVLVNGTPPNYEFWLSETLNNTTKEFPDQERIVFINAWNEWAEGCHLEPDRMYGHKFLEATARVKSGLSKLKSFADIGVPIQSIDRTRTVFADLVEVCKYHGYLALGAIKQKINAHPKARASALVILKALRIRS